MNGDAAGQGPHGRPVGRPVNEGTQASKERPIPFSAPMVRAILAGTKTQTRRIWKMPRGCSWYEGHGGEAAGMVQDDEGPAWWHVSEQRCPYGQPGDRLWVRETWRLWGSASFAANGEPLDPDIVTGPLAGMRAEFLRSRPIEYRADTGDDGPWRSPIHMPRWASRITLEVTGVRVERLQEISEADAIAEGCVNSLHLQGGRLATENFRWLWEYVKGDDAWLRNPWVWVVEFKRV